MNNFELHEKAIEMVDTNTSYQLARKLLTVEKELKSKPLKNTENLQKVCLVSFMDYLQFTLKDNTFIYYGESDWFSKEVIKISYNNAVRLYNLTQEVMLSGVKGKIIVNGSGVQSLKNMVTNYKLSLTMLEEALNNKHFRYVYLQHKKKTNEIICQKHLLEFC